jgi:DNA-binding response OmpR family regulator
MKLLIIEDEKKLNQLLTDFFRKAGMMVVSAFDKFQAEDELLVSQFDLVLLDITLPDGSGLDLIPLIKSSQQNAGLLIISAKNSLDDKINGLDLGADDYITKPFHLAELNSRVNAIIRRKNYQGEEQLVFNEIHLNVLEKQVTVDGKAIPLTRKEYDLLNYFLVNKNRVLTKEAIADHLLGSSMEFNENFDFIYTHIKNLRKKIEQAGAKDYVKSVHGLGYKYTDS